MSVPSIYNRVIATANGSSTEFSFNWEFLAVEDIKVYVENILKIIDDDYIIVYPDTKKNGKVVFNAIPIAGSIVVIERVDNLQQDRNFKNQSSFNANEIEKSYDKLTRQIQDVVEILNNSAVKVDSKSNIGWKIEDIKESDNLLYVDLINKTIKTTRFSFDEVVQSENIVKLRQIIDMAGNRSFQYSLDGVVWYTLSDASSLSAEIVARQNADDILQDNIDAEEQSRENADITLDNKMSALANAGLASRFFDFGFTGEVVFVIPVPGNTTDTYYDFTTNTPYTAKSDLSGWDAGTPEVLEAPVKYAISNEFWDLIDGSSFPGTAIYSPDISEWGLFPDRVGSGDNITIESNLDGTLSVINGSITSEKIANGTIVNEDISTNADIAQSKIAGLATSFNEKFDKVQSIGNANKYLKIDEDGNITFVDGVDTIVSGAAGLFSLTMSLCSLDYNTTGQALLGTGASISKNDCDIWDEILADYNSGSSTTLVVNTRQGTLDTASPIYTITCLRGGTKGFLYIPTSDTTNIAYANAILAAGYDSSFIRINVSAETFVLPTLIEHARFTNNTTMAGKINNDQVVRSGTNINGVSEQFANYGSVVEISGAQQIAQKGTNNSMQTPTFSGSGNSGRVLIDSAYGLRTGTQVQPRSTNYLVYMKIKNVALDTNIYTDTTLTGNGSELSPLSVVGGSDTYTNLTPSAITVGGIPVGTTFTEQTMTNMFDALLYPELFPTLVSPNNAFSLTQSGLREIGEIISTLSFTASFNRGTITPAYGTSGFRSGLPSFYKYTGTGLPSSVSSSSLTNNQTVSSYTVLTGIQTWDNIVTSLVGEQPLSSKGNDYSTPYPAGDTGNKTVSITGVYPWYYNSVSLILSTKQTLVVNGSVVITSMLEEDGTNKQFIEFPTGWGTITKLEQFNTLSGSWDTISLSAFTISATTKTIQGNIVNYTKYTYNGATIGARQLRWTV